MHPYQQTEDLLEVCADSAFGSISGLQLVPSNAFKVKVSEKINQVTFQ